MSKKTTMAMLVTTSLAFALSPSHAWAGKLSCDSYKSMLNEALSSTRIGKIDDYHTARDEGNGLRQYKFSSGIGVDGLLTCDKTGNFGSFEFGMKPPGGVGGAVPTRFNELAANSMCVLTSSDMTRCGALVSHLVSKALDSYGAATQNDKYANGNAEADLFPPYYGSYAAVDIGGGEYEWAVGPGHYSTIEEGRPPLDPRDHGK